MIVPDQYIFKTLPVQFFGKRFSLKTSQELFCCNSVDAGSLLLMNSVVREISLPGNSSIIDIGCGTGVLSLAMFSQYENAQVTAVDRDALALAFTAMNCTDNGFAVTVEPSLGAAQVFDRTYDLVLSNIPAKAGNVVIQTMISDFSHLAGEKGTVAVVIVKTLADLAEEAILNGKGTILYKKKTPEYTVFHYRGMEKKLCNAGLEPYKRGTLTLETGKSPVDITTVYGLPEFDSISYGTSLLVSLLSGKKDYGSVLVINPSQGFIPVTVVQNNESDNGSLHIAGRDYLSLTISEKNVQETCGIQCAVHHAATLCDIEGSFDTIIVLYEKEAAEKAVELTQRELLRLTAAGGEVYFAGSSTSVHRFEQASGKLFSKRGDKKSRGFRAVHMKKRDTSQ